MKIGVADYGMNVWYGGCYDYENRLMDLKDIGYEGIEKLNVQNNSDLVNKSAKARKLGMDFGTVSAPTPELSIKWTSAMNKEYIWVSTSPKNKKFNVFCRQVNRQAEICKKWNISVALHNHMGTLVETQEQLESFLEKCPECMLVLDTAHLAAVQGVPEEIVRKYPDRIQTVHLKDWILKEPDAENWYERGRFCELGSGNIDLDNLSVMEALKDVGFDDWVFIEHDEHKQNPLKDLKISRDYLKKAGY